MLGKVNRLKSLSLYFGNIKKKMLLFSEIYLEPSQTFTMEIFCENSELLKVVNYIRKKALL